VSREDVLNLYAEGLSIGEVAKRLGESYGRVRRLIRTAGKARDRHETRRRTIERRNNVTAEHMVRLYLEGYALSVIAETASCCEQFVWRVVRRAGIMRTRGDSKRLNTERKRGGKPKRLPKRCPRCSRSDIVILSNGYCRPCMAEYMRGQYAPTNPKSYEQLAEAAHLTGTEKMLVNRCVQFMRNPGKHEPAEFVLMGMPWRRQVTLMSCAVAKARESNSAREESA
jgi:hypothetical protein